MTPCCPRPPPLSFCLQGTPISKEVYQALVDKRAIDVPRMAGFDAVRFQGVHGGKPACACAHMCAFWRTSTRSPAGLGVWSTVDGMR